MITVEMYREDQVGRFLLDRKSVPLVKACWMLLHSELQFGGWFDIFKADKIEVVTPLIGQNDVTVFSGPEGDMQHLADASALFYSMNPALLDWFKAKLDALRSPRTSTMIEAIAAHGYSGQRFAEKSRVALAALVLGDDRERLDTYLKAVVEIKDTPYRSTNFLAAAELLFEGHAPEEVLGLVAA